MSVSMIVETDNEIGKEKDVNNKKTIVKYNNKSLGPFEVFVKTKEEILKNIGNFRILSLSKMVFYLKNKDVKKLEKTEIG